MNLSSPKQNYVSSFLRAVRPLSYKLTFFIAITLLLPCLLPAQISSVSLKSYQACGGATIVPFCVYSTPSFTPVTIYYERMVSASVWQLEGIQVYNNKTSYIMYNGDDLLAASTFRV